MFFRRAPAMETPAAPVIGREDVKAMNAEEGSAGEILPVNNARTPGIIALPLATPTSTRAGPLASGALNAEDSRDRPSTSRSLSLATVFTSARTKRTLSLPVARVTKADHVAEQDSHTIDMPRSISLKYTDAETKSQMRNGNRIKRSLSVPENFIKGRRSLHRNSSIGGWIRVTPATSKIAFSDAETDCHGGEEIPEEDAVCRICFVELADGETLNMECSCKGELALVHKECAVKWFSIKGNNRCDICKKEVENLPVTLTRIPNPSVRRQSSSEFRSTQTAEQRVLQEVPALVIVSMIAYFCFLEQHLVPSMGSLAATVSLPLSFALGLLSSMITLAMASMTYIWAFATFQFVAVILFSHIFYTELGLSAVLSVLLACFIIFGIAICGSSLLMDITRRRSRRRLIWSFTENLATEPTISGQTTSMQPR